MAESIPLRFGQGHVTLYRSETKVAARAERATGETPATRERRFDRAIDAITRSAQGRRDVQLGDFEIIDVPPGNMRRTRDALRRARAAGRPRPVYHTSPADKTPFVPVGTIHLRFPDGTADVAIDAALARHGCRRAGWTGSFARVESANPDTVAVAAALQAEFPEAEIEPDLVTPCEALTFEPPADARFGALWHLENRGDQPGLTGGADARVTGAWRRLGGFGSEEVIVAVMDGGFDLGHLDLAGKTVGAFDFVDNDTEPIPAGWDAHGTACAAVAVAALGGGEVIGVAPMARLMPLRTGAISAESVARWFDHARTSGAWVVSCSWSALADVYPLPGPAAEAIHRCATEGRGGKGAVIVFAAGNNRRGVNDPPRTLNGFAIHPDVLAVAASTSRDTHASYSSTGREIAVCAPSAGAPGRPVTTADVTDALGDDGRMIARGYASGDYYAAFAGTSCACPVVAGVCALALTAHPDLTAAEVRDLVRSTSRRIGDGYVDGHSPRFGRGCVDAESAVAAALAARGTTPIS